jgi:hypothetical protein
MYNVKQLLTVLQNTIKCQIINRTSLKPYIIDYVLRLLIFIYYLCRK